MTEPAKRAFSRVPAWTARIAATQRQEMEAAAAEQRAVEQCARDTFSGSAAGPVFFGGGSANTPAEMAAMRASHVTVATPQKNFHARACLTPTQATRVVGSGMQALAPLFAEAEHGHRSLERLMVSGHGGPNGPFQLELDQLVALAQLFPKAAAQVRHIFLPSCHSNHATTVDRVKHAFPNLQTFSGYDSFAPTGALAIHHMEQWLEATKKGSTLAGLDPKISTWTATRGFRGTQPPDSLESLDGMMQASIFALDRYLKNERPKAEAKADPQLRALYELLVRLAHHPDASAEARRGYAMDADIALKLRHPERH